MLIDGVTAIQLPVWTDQAELLGRFHRNCQGKSELERIVYAEQLLLDVRDHQLPLSVTTFPAVPQRQDWWFLIQVFALDRYVRATSEPIPFDLTAAKTLFVESFSDLIAVKGEPLRSALWDALTDGEPTEKTSRYGWTHGELLSLLQKNAAQALSTFDFSSDTHEVRLLYLDEFLRLKDLLPVGQAEVSTYLHGFRQRADGKLLPLIAGNSRYGGVNFVDSWWPDVAHEQIIPRFVIAEKS